MRKLLILASVVAMAAPAVTLVAAPTEASANSCSDASTAAGGVGGAVIGGGLAHGGVGGAILGGVGGALIGHAVADNNCHRHRHYVSCRYETHYRDRDHQPYQVRLCAGRDGVWHPA